MSFIDIVLHSNKKHCEEGIGEEKFDDMATRSLRVE